MERSHWWQLAMIITLLGGAFLWWHLKGRRQKQAAESPQVAGPDVPDRTGTPGGTLSSMMAKGYINWFPGITMSIPDPDPNPGAGGSGSASQFYQVVTSTGS